MNELWRRLNTRSHFFLAIHFDGVTGYRFGTCLVFSSVTYSYEYACDMQYIITSFRYRIRDIDRTGWIFLSREQLILDSSENLQSGTLCKIRGITRVASGIIRNNSIKRIRKADDIIYFRVTSIYNCHHFRRFSLKIRFSVSCVSPAILSGSSFRYIGIFFCVGTITWYTCDFGLTYILLYRILLPIHKLLVNANFIMSETRKF